jgi:hypothetical protein
MRNGVYWSSNAMLYAMIMIGLAVPVYVLQLIRPSSDAPELDFYLALHPV